ncbi:MAG: TrkH family potassium uptake protein [Candidatus Bathyarchaeia archaeon]
MVIRSTSVLKAMTALLSIVGLLALSVPAVDALTGSDITVSFLVLSAVLIPIGFVSYRIRIEEGLSSMEALFTSSLAWMLLPVVSAVPLSIATGISYFDAFFESLSGFTGTGLTILVGLDHMKPSILFWRALMQWTGEIGFVVFAIVLLPFFYKHGLLIYSLERPIKIEASLYRTARRLLKIYIILTVIGIFLLYYSGMNIFDAIVHSMTGISTGGMSNYDANYNMIFRRAPLTVAPLTIIMIFGATNFLLIDRLIRGEIRYVASNEEYRLYIELIIFFSLLSPVSVIMSQSSMNFSESFATGVFNAISAITTTGFSVGSVEVFPPATKLILVFGMFIGGMTFATVGGIKVLRFLILLKKFMTTSITLVTGGKIEARVKIGENFLDNVEVASALLLVVLHLIAIFAGASIIKSLLPERDFVDALFEAASASSCVGLSTGITSPSSPIGVKATLMALMFLGRLEYLPLLLFFGYLFGRRVLKLLK